jgi:hypothetical protein
MSIANDDDTDRMFTRLSSKDLENPMLRSGLALAGANTWLEHKPLPPEAKDGNLTAEDVSAMDLSIFLSLCVVHHFSC